MCLHYINFFQCVNITSCFPFSSFFLFLFNVFTQHLLFYLILFIIIIYFLFLFFGLVVTTHFLTHLFIAKNSLFLYNYLHISQKQQQGFAIIKQAEKILCKLVMKNHCNCLVIIKIRLL